MTEQKILERKFIEESLPMVANLVKLDPKKPEGVQEIYRLIHCFNHANDQRIFLANVLCELLDILLGASQEIEGLGDNLDAYISWLSRIIINHHPQKFS